MTVRGSFADALKPGSRKMPKGKPYHEKPTKSGEKKGKDEKPEMKFIPKGTQKRGARRMGA